MHVEGYLCYSDKIFILWYFQYSIFFRERLIFRICNLKSRKIFVLFTLFRKTLIFTEFCRNNRNIWVKFLFCNYVRYIRLNSRENIVWPFFGLSWSVFYICIFFLWKAIFTEFVILFLILFTLFRKRLIFTEFCRNYEEIMNIFG